MSKAKPIEATTQISHSTRVSGRGTPAGVSGMAPILAQTHVRRVDRPAPARDNGRLVPTPKSPALPAAVAEALDEADVRRCTALLEAIVADRGLLAGVPLELRRALLVAAGRASRPDSYQEKRLVKALRRRRRRDE